MDQLHKRVTDDWAAFDAEVTDDALFDAAVRLTAQERGAFLDRMCGTDEVRRRELLSLIEAHDSAGTFLQTPALAEPLAGIPVAGDDELTGALIGSYRVLDRVGTGGMGAVYLAERADQAFERLVAIKVIKRGMDTDEVLHGFHRERELLAGLDHPNIARLLDGGAMAPPDGRPYLVMEHVAGTRIDRYCDERGLSVRDRLALFRQACEAVQHAHQHLIVHRDLKPSNILVSGEGRVKLLDFGIAKMLDDPQPGSAGMEPTLTRQRRRFSPAYASPEQIRGDRITTGSDIYSLGVVLYELLTGERPHASSSGSLEDLERAICEERPVRPSVLMRMRAPLPVPAARRRFWRPGKKSAATALNRELAGDLDTIILTALEKEPERRYASVAALADDVRRFLDGEPIAARSPSMAEQFRRFVRRNRALTGIATAAAAGLMLTAAGTSIGLVRANEAGREARSQQAAAEQFGAFLKEMLASVGPHMARGRDTTLLREILITAEHRLDDELTARSMPPEALISLHNVLGSAYRGLGEYEESQRRFEVALELARRSFRSDHPATMSTLLGLATALTDAGQFQLAEPYADEALEMALRLHGSDGSGTADAFNAIARVNRLQGRYADAENHFREALEIARRVEGETSQRTTTILNNLADTLEAQGRYAEAEAIFENVADIRRRTLPADHPDLLVSINNLASARRELGDAAGAVEAHREVLEIRRRILGPDHDHVATTLMNIAVALSEMGRTHEAIDATREAIDIYRRALPPDHPWTAKGLSNLGAMLAMEGILDEAEQVHREALEMRLRTFDGDHAEVAMSLYSLGALHAERGDFDLSEQFHRDALEMRRRVFGEEHPHVGWSIAAIGRVHLDRGEGAEAGRLFREALDMRRSLLGERHALVARSLRELAEALAQEGRFDEAIPLFQDALAQHRELLPPHHRATAATLRELGRALTLSGRPDEAIDHLREALEISDGPPPLPRNIRGRTRAALGECLAALADDAGAQPMLEEALALLHGSPADRRTIVSVMHHLRAIYEEHGRTDDAERLRREIVSLQASE